MLTIACHTLGCKVNQYDTQAMMELFQNAGYTEVPFSSPADIYLVNTCTVTGTGDKKSLQLARRLKREFPGCTLILCGCMAQHQAGRLFEAGADLVVGTQRRGEIVSLTESFFRTGEKICAVEPMKEGMPFEPLMISGFMDHTRATLKIQEGCNNRCTYCIIPQVRGPIRSRPVEEIRAEALRLRDAGFKEFVLTGIHLSSYGKDLGTELPDAVEALQDIQGILRIRLGSLEPTVISSAFSRRLAKMDKVCPQFHLALQSGSDSVLRRMKRQYNTTQYLHAVEILRDQFPHAAFTTDILTGFPGETEEEYRETRDMIERVGFSRIHVFPYSARPDTLAAEMDGQLTPAEKERRARELIQLGDAVSRRYLDTWIGLETDLLPEEIVDGCWEGYTPEYIRVRLAPEETCVCGEPVHIMLESVLPRKMQGRIIK